ncbi:uncharacterized protein LOC103576526 [Microplitis demolitor]|uniref:uncharacterized protein LOC103576526 n=1 Tax=Microplitis demolitor TaxID=69319 RepID=UPI00235B5FBD|nr:uncharacterized protein LOC103576526 [Microplitis demolitor]
MKYLLLFIVATFCIGFITTGHLNIFREEQQLLPHYYVHSPGRLLVCISDDPRDAVIWNNEIEWNPSIIDDDYIDEEMDDYDYSMNSSSEEKQCDIDIDSWECFTEWNHHNSQWNRTSSLDVPMGPVYDNRWEHFKELSKFDENDTEFYPVTDNRHKNSTHFTFHESGALVVSIRGLANAQFLLCRGQNYSHDFCYWLIIGGWHNTITAIRKCENGIPSGIPTPGSNCSILRASVTQHFPLTEFEWRTFIIEWEAENQTIKLFNPNELILTYSDPDFTSNIVDQIHYVFYGNPDSNMKMLYRFHEYHYILTHQPDAKLTSPPVNADYFHTICVDMLVGLCPECELLINLVDGNGTKQRTEIISRSLAYQNIKHDLPIWQYVRINASNVDKYQSPITLELTTKLAATGNDTKYHWALARFEKCLPDRAVKTISTNVVSLNSHPFPSWPNVTCQRFSYIEENTEIISSISNFYYPPEDFPLCPNFSFGPYCSTPCSKYFSYYCNHITMCTQNGCFCTQGYSGFRCQKPCERGSYGFECRKTCDNCLNERCDGYDGKCDSGCVQSTDRFHIPPYCNIVIESPPAPSIDHINETTVKIFLPELNEYKHVIILFIFEIESDSEKSQSKLATDEVLDINSTKKKIYSAIFTNLTIGTKYSVRSLATIHYDENQYKHMEGAWKTFSTLCDWDSKFEIESGETSILLKRISQKQASSCSDSWYNVELRMIFNSNKSYPININHVPHKFPMLFTNLAPFTHYRICLNNADVKFNFCQEIHTLEAEPSEVELIKHDSVHATEAEIGWFPPIFPNGKILGYNLTIRVIQHAGCEDSFLETPKSLMTPRTVLLNDSDSFRMSYKFTDLIPYVIYEVTILAYNSKSHGDESKIRIDTDQLEIPTEIFEDLKFEKNIITWRKPSNCSLITGPIIDARFVLVGLSEYVRNFSFQILKGEFKVYLTDIKGIYGDEQYRARVYVLHYPKRIHNETAYAEISFKTDPSPPPKVEKLEIVEVNQQEETMTLRWQKPLSPTNGEIIYYAIRFSGTNIETTDIAQVYPNETCKLWKDLLCTSIKQPFGTREYIEVRAYNKGVNKGGDVDTVEYQPHEGAPSAPEITSIEEIDKGVVDLRWKHPWITGGPLKSFMITIKILSSRLEKLREDFNKIYKKIEFPITEYKMDYSTHINLLPSTLYILSVKGVTKLQHGLESFIEVETRNTLAFEFEPHLIASGDDSTIKVVIPPIVNNTVNSILNIVVKGESMCEEGSSLDSTLENDVGLEYHESAWLAASFTTRKKMNRVFIIGDGESYNGNINCPLHVDKSYVVVIVVHDSQTVRSIIWKSPTFTVGTIIKASYVYWLVPLLLLLILGSGFIYFYLKKRNKKSIGLKPDRLSVHHTTKKVNEYVNRIQNVSPDHQELISLNPGSSVEELSPFSPFASSNNNLYNVNL